MDRHRKFGQVVEYRTKRVYNKGVLGDTGVKRSPWEYLTEYNIRNCWVGVRSTRQRTLGHRELPFR
jgi:hypothetical protein